MPVITSFSGRTPTSIDQRVQSAAINTSGAGAVARAVSNLGTQGAQLANKALLLQKKDEADQFSSTSKVGKGLARQANLRGLQITDPDYIERVTKFEREYDERVAEEAPTDLARRTYLKNEVPNSDAKILNAGLKVFAGRKSAYKQNLAINTDSRAKELQNIQSEDLDKLGGTITSEGEDKLADTLDSVRGGEDSGFYNDPVEVVKDSRREGNKISVGAFRAMDRNKKYGEMFEGLGLNRLINENEEVSNLVKKNLSAALKVDVNDVFYNEQTGRVDIGTEKGKMSVDPTSGQVTESISLPSQGITIEGDFKAPPKKPVEEKKPSLLLEFLDPNQQQAFILKAVSGMLQQTRKSSEAILAKLDNQMAALTAEDGVDGKETYSTTEGNAFSDTLRENAREYISLPDSLVSPTKKEKVVGKLFAAAATSQRTEAMKWTNSGNIDKLINGVDEDVVKFSESIGYPLTKENTKRVSLNAKAGLRNAKSRRDNLVTTDPAAYVEANDESIQDDVVLLENLTNSLIQSRTGPQTDEGRAAQTKVQKQVKDLYNQVKKDKDARYDQLGLGSLNREYFTKAKIQGDSQRLQSLIKSGTGNKEQAALFLQEAVDTKGDLGHSYMNALIKEKAISPALLLALNAPRDAKSVRMVEDLLDVTHDRPAIREMYNSRRATTIGVTGAFSDASEAEIQGMVHNELAPMAIQFSKGGNFGSRREELNSYADAVATRAMSLLNDGKATDANTAVKDAVDYFIGRSFTASEGGTFHIDNRTMDKHSLNIPEIDSLTEFYEDPANFPVEGIDFVGMTSRSKLAEIAGEIKRTTGVDATKDRLNSILGQEFKDSKLGSISVQNEGDGVYFTVNPQQGLARRPEVIKKKVEKGQKAKAFKVPYADIKSNSTIQEMAAERVSDDETAVNKMIDNLRGMFGKSISQPSPLRK